MQISFPLFVRAKDSGEIVSVNSIYDLQRHVERIDVENSEYEAWDTVGIPVAISSQEPVWLEVKVLGSISDIQRLRQALAEFAKAVGLTIEDNLPVSSFGAMLAQISDAHEKKKLGKSAIRRFFKKLS
jgi:4'-phosphopantetheinyl transferase EntD